LRILFNFTLDLFAKSEFTVRIQNVQIARSDRIIIHHLERDELLVIIEEPDHAEVDFANGCNTIILWAL
jgi:hypothetical protein